MAHLKLTLPGPGVVKVLETTGSNRLTFARRNATAASAGPIGLTVAPTRKGKRLLAHHRRPVIVHMSVSFTPTGGLPNTLHIPRIRLTGRCPARR